jgi:molybdopterin-guanine dinucleotide biosynthesis protein B
MEKPPIVAVVGKSNAGKTTFLEKLIKELKNRNIKVGTIKHDVHGFDMDRPGKDTWRHAQAGADAVIISSPSKMAVIKKAEQEMSLDQIAGFISDMDIILTEGYKRSTKPKIEISRMAHSSELLCTADELIALVSDADWNLGVPVFELDDAAGVAGLLQEKYGLPGQERSNVILSSREMLPSCPGI